MLEIIANSGSLRKKKQKDTMNSAYHVTRA
jgi:hypothetical protein